MMKIIICDDQKSEYLQLRELLDKYCKERYFDLDVQYFSSGKELIESQIEEVDLFFLDVEMPGLNGIETGKEIRKRNKNCEIVFVTNYIQYALQGYEVQAFRYLLKPIDGNHFTEIADHLFEKIRKSSSFIQIKGRSDTKRVLIGDIVYAETSQRHLLIHTKNQRIDCYQTMEKLEESLSQHGFYRCHHAYLVSMEEIAQIKGNDAVLKDGTVIPISKAKKKQFKQVLTDYWGGKFL